MRERHCARYLRCYHTAYELRHSTTASVVRESLRTSGVSVSEAEFRKLYAARRQFEEFCKPSGSKTINATVAWNEYKASSRRILGEERSLKMNAASANVSHAKHEF
jgi:hypothetical protein